MSLRMLMKHRVDVQVQAVTKDASGGKVNTWTVAQAALPCRVEPASAEKVYDFQKLGMKVSHAVYYIPSDLGVRLTDQHRLNFAGRLLEVRSVRDFDESQRCGIAFCFERVT